MAIYASLAHPLQPLFVKTPRTYSIQPSNTPTTQLLPLCDWSQRLNSLELVRMGSQAQVFRKIPERENHKHHQSPAIVSGRQLSLNIRIGYVRLY